LGGLQSGKAVARPKDNISTFLYKSNSYGKKGPKLKGGLHQGPKEGGLKGERGRSYTRAGCIDRTKRIVKGARQGRQASSEGRDERGKPSLKTLSRITARKKEKGRISHLSRS